MSDSSLSCSSAVYVACGGSVQGTRHIRSSIPCEDAWAHETLPGCLILAIADGLSSSELGGKGAELASTASVGALFDLMKKKEFGKEGIDMPEILRRGVAVGRNALEVCATSENELLSSYGTTLLVVVLMDGTAWCGHIGDGTCITVTGDDATILSAPGNAEYANETPVLTGTDWEKHLRISSGDADAIILATDGCQGALIRKESGDYVPYYPFILPLMKTLKEYYLEGRDCNAEICDLLFSDRMRALSSDDMTLVTGFCSSGVTSE